MRLVKVLRFGSVVVFSMKTSKTMPDGKIVDTTDHGDGRKSVVVNVCTIKVENPDAGDEAAAKIINEQILPKLRAQEVMVLVLHKPSHQFANFVCKLTEVREFAQKVVDAFPTQGLDTAKPDVKEFVIIETQGVEQRVTTL